MTQKRRPRILLFWLLVCLAYLQTFAEGLLHIIETIRTGATVTPFDFVEFSAVVYVPFLMYLLVRKHRAGWGLVFMHNIFLLMSLVLGAYIIMGSGHLQPEELIFAIVVLARIALAYMLWQRDTTERYNISEADMKQAVYFPIVFAPVILIIGIVVAIASGRH